MRVGLNALSLQPGSGGEDLYLRRTIATIRKVQPDVHFVAFTAADTHAAFAEYERILIGKPGPEEAGTAAERTLDRAVRAARVDRVLSPLAGAPVRPGTPLVLSVFDPVGVEEALAAPRRFGSDPAKEIRRACAAAACIVAPSEFVRRRLLELLRIPMNQMVVATPGVDEGFEQAQTCFVQRPYLLSVGDTHSRNNIALLLDAVRRINEEGPIALVVVGRAGAHEPEDWGPGVIRIEDCPAPQLAGLYQHCEAMVSASLHEGAVLGILEALRAGARVVAPRAGGIPETAGNAPIYFNPDSSASLVGAIRRALGELPEEHAQQCKFGRQRAAQFTWEACAWRMLFALRREPE